MNIKEKSANATNVINISERYSLPFLTSSILDKRDVDLRDVKYYLEEDIIYEHSPFLVDDVYSACERINEALGVDGGEEEIITIFGDRDADGITATALMYLALQRLGAKKVITRLPHGDEDYGLSLDIATEIIESGTTLLITVDNGITSIEEISYLEKNGVSVIVLDHHLPGEKLPPAEAIFDPKVEGSGYPFNGLCGCAVAFKLSYALFFTRTPLWNSDIILLHAELGNDTIRVNAVRLENLIETERCSDEFLIGGKNSSSPLLSFLSRSLPIVVLDAEIEKGLLRKAFGKNVDISLYDFRDKLEKQMPKSRGKTLFDLSCVSRAARYQRENRELATLVSLFRSVSIRENKILTEAMADLTQLASIATIADLMPMKDENRLIVKRGLKLLSTKPMNSLSYLLSRQGLVNKPIDSTSISYKIAPVLNASGRLGCPEEALKLILSTTQSEIIERTDKLLELNSERQRREEEALGLIEEKAKSSYLENNGKVIMVESDKIERGITGSLASKLQNEYQIPCIVLAIKDEKISGSLRSPASFSSRDFLSLFSYLLEDYGGHKAAAGLRMDKSNLSEFTTRVKEYFETISETEAKDEEIEVDAVLKDSDLVKDVWSSLDIFSPYGQENETLKFYLTNVEIVDKKLMGENGKFMRLSLNIGGIVWPSIWWNPENIDQIKEKQRVNIVFTPEINWWKGVGKEQLNILKLEVI